MKFRFGILAGAVVLAGLPAPSLAGLAEDKAAAFAAHERRLNISKNFHSEGGGRHPIHKGHRGHGGEHMNERPLEDLVAHHEEHHHHSSGMLPIKSRLPEGQHGVPHHIDAKKDQRGNPHNPPDLTDDHRHSDVLDFGIDEHTGRKRIKLKDVKEHIWDKDDPEHPHAHKFSTKLGRRRKFKDHPLRKYDWMEDEAKRLAHEHTLAYRSGNKTLAEELAHKKRAIDLERRHLDMMHHGMTEEEYQEFKGWQSELEELNNVDSHGLDHEARVAHRDRMVELAMNIKETKEHYSFVAQPKVRPHATLEENIKMHKLFEAIHKTNDKQERAALKQELKELKDKIRFEEKHRVYDEDDVETIKALRQQLTDLEGDDDHLEKEKIRMAIQEIYLSYDKKKAERLGHVLHQHAHDEHKNKQEEMDNPQETPTEIADHLIHSDPEIIELHEELHHLESNQFEEKARIDKRIKNRMYELKHNGTMPSDHIKGHLDIVWDAEKYHEENNIIHHPREAEPQPDRRAKPIIIT